MADVRVIELNDLVNMSPLQYTGMVRSDLTVIAVL